MSKSAQIRDMYDQGMKVQQIADALGIRYQFAYNVVSHHVKTKALQVREITAAQVQAAPTQGFNFWNWLLGK